MDREKLVLGIVLYKNSDEEPLKLLKKSVIHYEHSFNVIAEDDWV